MKKEELKKEYESGTVTITKDNIHLYYEFMSDEDLEKISNILVPYLTDRYFYIFNKLNIDIDKNDICFKIEGTYFLEDKDSKGYPVRQSFFGTKDILKPIDEYIADIKESSEYKEYIANLKYDYKGNILSINDDGLYSDIPERCPECQNLLNADDYKDFTNKTVCTCPQCSEDIYLQY